MKKLLEGVARFHQNVRPRCAETFAGLVRGQSPHALFVTCSDSRLVPHLFTSADPGDLFVVRNVGNLIPPCRPDGTSAADESEAAAVEFAVLTLHVSDIVLCGHSECGAIRALLDGRERVTSPNLRAWLRHAEKSAAGGEEPLVADGSESRQDRVSRLNVLQQMAHLQTYPCVQAGTEAGRLRLHAWWFEISTASVYVYENRAKRFILLDESPARTLPDNPPRDG